MLTPDNPQPSEGDIFTRLKAFASGATSSNTFLLSVAQAREFVAEVELLRTAAALLDADAEYYHTFEDGMSIARKARGPWRIYTKDGKELNFSKTLDANCEMTEFETALDALRFLRAAEPANGDAGEVGE